MAAVGLRSPSLAAPRVHPVDVARRGMDIAVALAGVIILALVAPFVALAIALDSPGPIIHRRRVLGARREFDAFKFRTMVTNADDVLNEDLNLRDRFNGRQKLDGDPRVTRVGRFLRKTSIDELPQLYNVLKGEMSLVGPRMIHRAEAEKFGEFLAVRQSVKPGITGLWQIKGRSLTTYEERVELDREYMRTRSFWLDLKILLLTIPAVLSARGAH